MTDVVPLRSGARQYVILGIVFAAVSIALAVAYWLFLRPGYAVLAERIRPTEAAVVVAELDKRAIAYRLRDGGTTILVPEDQADATRLAIAGSDIAATGQVGFELFNKSDMGLTNFAQKINYQRALQGELVRTITQMDGVESARVHLALPERALFRDDRTEPSAAVTVAMKPPEVLDPARVSGIQRLVAAAVPDLPAARVAVLDARGRVISQTAMADAEPASSDQQPAADEERAAVEQYHRARARSVIEGVLPSVRFMLKALVLPVDDAADWAPAGEGAARNYRLRLTMVTETPLDPAQQDAVRNAVIPSLALQPHGGDELSFATGPVAPRTAQAPAATPAPAPLPAIVAPAPIGEPSAGGWTPGLWWLGVPLMLAIAWFAWRRSGSRRLLPANEHDAFAQTLRRQLALIDEAGHAAR